MINQAFFFWQCNQTINHPLHIPWWDECLFWFRWFRRVGWYLDDAIF